MIYVKTIPHYAPASSLYLLSEEPLAELSFTERQKERAGSRHGLLADRTYCSCDPVPVMTDGSFRV